MAKLIILKFTCISFVCVFLSTLTYAANSYDNCTLSQKSSPFFLWRNGMPHFLDHSFNECHLLSNAPLIPPKNQSHFKKLQVLSFGDSFEQGYCFAHPHGRQLSYIKGSSGNGSEYLYTYCSKKEETVQYYVRRTFGQNGTDEKITSKWHLGNLSTIAGIYEMSRYLSQQYNSALNATLQSKDSLKENSSPSGAANSNGIDVVIHGSFLWDLKHSHYAWCSAHKSRCNDDFNASDFRGSTLTRTQQRQQHEHERVMFVALCNHATAVSNMNHLDYTKQCNSSSSGLLRSANLSGNHSLSSSYVRHRVSPVVSAADMPQHIEQIVQSWNRLTAPWCDSDFLQQWQATYLKEVSALLVAFPGATLFLRTQPIGAAMFLGNHRCHKHMNDFIVHVVGLSHQLYTHVNNTNSGGGGNSSSMFHNRKLRLIDQYSLFATSSDDGTDHFQADYIHLTAARFKFYRGYVLRVLTDFMNEQRGGVMKKE